LIDAPVSPSGLDTERIALSRSPITLDYFADSQWTDRAPLVVQTALLDSFENSRAIVAVDRDSPELHADFVLKSEMRHFEAVYDQPDRPPRVWITLNLRLVRAADRTIIAQHSVERQVQAAATNVPSVVAAFNQALGQAMEDIVVWTVRNPGLTARLPSRPS